MSNKARRLVLNKVSRNQSSKGITAFYPQIYHGYAYSLLSQRHAQSRLHPLHPKIVHKYQIRNDPLWWTFIASLKNLGNKASLRNWVVRKARVSFEQALLESGYDKTGRWINGNKEGKDLKGMTDLVLAPEAVTMSVEELKEQSLLVIKMLKTQESKRLAKIEREKIEREKLEKGKRWKLQYWLATGEKLLRTKE